MPPKKATAGNRSLPKFGEWDVNNPQSGEGFTVIFNTHRDQKKNDRTNAGAGPVGDHQNNQGNQNQKDKQNHNSTKNKWLCCIFGKSS